MSLGVRLLSASVRYGGGFKLHTALSGPVAELDELYLLVERDGVVIGFSEIRENVAYLTGLSPDEVRAAIIAILEAADWNVVAEGDAKAVRDAMAPLAPLPRTLIDTLLWDMEARGAGLPLAEHLGGAFSGGVETNQCLQLSNPSDLSEQVSAYVERGYRKIKLRVGDGRLEEDVAKLQTLRDAFGSQIDLAVDANGSWPADDVPDFLPRLEPFELSYIEQPVPPGDMAALELAVSRSPAPIMLDEAASDLETVTRLARSGLGVWMHLKLVKMGKVSDLLAAARLLHELEIPFMIGQMNEGAGATAASLHCVMAARPQFAELYGADGLIDDPVSGIDYRDGCVQVARLPGLGVSFDPSNCDCLWELKL